MASSPHAGPSAYPQPNLGSYGALTNGPPAHGTSGAAPWTLMNGAASLIDKLKRGISSSTSPAPSSAELSVHLYALHTLSAAHARASWTRGHDVRTRVEEQYERERVAAELLRAVKVMLENQVGQEVDEDELSEMFWRPWAIDERRSACAIELLLPPFATSCSARLLAHPLISASLDSVWRHGLLVDASSTRQAKLRFLRSAITPRRLHAFHLLSFLILYGLALYLSLHPGKLFTPYPSTEGGAKQKKAGVIEGLAVLWIAWDIWPTMYHRYNPTRLLLMSPLYLALLSTRPSPQIAFALLTLSIPCLTTLLVLPHYPSFALLSADSYSPESPTSLLSLSCILSATLHRLIRPFMLIAPLVLGLVGVFSYAMNGDLSRGFVILNSPASAVVSVEEGIAPFQTRVALFISIILLLVYALITGIATSANRLSAGGDPRRGAGQTANASESETAQAGRMRFAQAVLLGLGRAKLPIELSEATQMSDDTQNGAAREADEESRLLLPQTGRQAQDGSHRTFGPAQCAVPLDQLLAPFDLVKGLVTLAGALGWKGSAAWRVKMGKAMDGAVVVIMGPLCTLMIPLEWVSDWIWRKSRPR